MEFPLSGPGFSARESGKGKRALNEAQLTWQRAVLAYLLLPDCFPCLPAPQAGRLQESLEITEKRIQLSRTLSGPCRRCDMRIADCQGTWKPSVCTHGLQLYV